MNKWTYQGNCPSKERKPSLRPGQNDQPLAHRFPEGSWDDQDQLRQSQKVSRFKGSSS